MTDERITPVETKVDIIKSEISEIQGDIDSLREKQTSDISELKDVHE